MSAQLLKPGTWYYDDDEENKIRVMKGTPQGGWLSTLFFVMALDLIMKQNRSILKLLENGQILAFADDLLITVQQNRIWEIELVIKQLTKFGLTTNPNKWNYISPHKISELEPLGQYKTSIKYLGIKLTYSKLEQVKNIKNDINKNIPKLRKFCNYLPQSISKTMEQALFRSIALYHLGPALLANEINFCDAKKILKSTESKIKIIPAWWNSELMLSINPRELTINWIRRTIQKQIINLRKNKIIGQEITQWLWNHLDSTQLTGWILWRQGFKFNSKDIEKLLNPEIFRTVMQINKNCFFEIDKDTKYRYICPWGKVWNKIHRLSWTTCPINHLRLFSIKNHEIYYENGPFNTDRYVKDVMNAKNKIINLGKIEKDMISNEMWDNTQPKLINLNNTASWIRNKIEIVMMIKGNDIVIEGEEYKIFENLWIGLKNKIFIPFPIELDNSPLYKIPKSKKFINDEINLKEWTNEETNKTIESQLKKAKSNFFFPPQITRELARILKETSQNVTVEEIEEVLYSYLWG